jgi:oxygen-independent coproporphyrinogen III oxidase
MDLEKYNVPVPRYTSYPPANHFSTDFTGRDYGELISGSNNRKPDHIAIYIHIPFCRHLCFYCGCNSCKLEDDARVKDYIDAVRSEMLMVTGLLDSGRKISQIHFGGGTPNSIKPGYLTGLVDLLSDRFDFIENPEIAIECNPAQLDLDYLQALKDSKFNRYSLGIQDFNRKVLKTVNRRPSVLPVDELIGFIRKDGGSSVNLDFIYGLPLQTAASFAETISHAISMRPDRLVTFSYAHVPWMKKAQLILEKTGLPGPREKMEMFNTASGLLKEAGYMPVGLDHYVLPGDELNIARQNNMLHRNFQGYCSRRTTGQVYAFGVSAISQLEGGYSQNTKDIDSYIAQAGKSEFAVEKGYRLSRKEKAVREIITSLMCNYRLDFAELSAGLGESTGYIRKMADFSRLRSFAADDMLDFDDKRIIVREKGKFFIRNIAASFDPAYRAGKNKYSRPV